MRKALYIVLAVVLLTACGATQTAPLDDSYYWPDGQQQTTQTDETHA